MEKLKKMSRRGFLGGGLALGAVALGNHLAHKNSSEKDAADNSEPLPINDTNMHEHEAGAREYRMGDLAGRKFAAELSSYTGIHGDVPKVARIDFKHQLDHMWSEKMSRISSIGGDAMPIVQFGQELTSAYDPEQSTKMNLDNYERTIQTALNQVRIPNIELIRKIPSFAHCTDAQLFLIKSLESTIDARTLLAYSVTEIMPTSRGDSIVGVELFDFLLHNAGSEFIAAIPAEHDGYLSFGPYQFTRYAIGDVAHEHNGASVMNSVLRKSQLPEYIGDMRGDDHHKAAYLLALYNIAHVVKNLGAAQSKKLLDNVDTLPPETVLEYIATAHHLPGNAITAFKQFAHAYTMPPKAHSDVSSATFAHFCKANGIADYCDKTDDNRKALEEYLNA